MSRKAKGSNAERDLVHRFWAESGWSAIRIAGSGSSRYPSADLLASNKLRTLAIECKTSKSTSKYLPHEEIQQFNEFARTFGAEPWVAVKFNNSPWRFLFPEDLKKTSGSYAITRTVAEQKGLLLDELIQKKEN